jgi:hypothetical protein
MRRAFVRGLMAGLRVIWPVLSGLIAAIVTAGLVTGLLEGWSVQESLYFAFVTGLTIGYGDFAPKTFTTRVLALVIGVCGLLLTALLAAIAVRALGAASPETDGKEDA